MVSAVLQIGDSPVWRRALQGCRHDVYHLPGYVAVEADRSLATPAAYVYTEDDSTFLLPLLLEAVEGADVLDAKSPYGYPGPVANNQDPRFWSRACRSLERVLRDAGVIACFVRVHPLLKVDMAAMREVGVVVQHGVTVSLDLRSSEEQLWAQMRHNHRRQIAKARRAKFTVAFDGWAFLDDFVEMYYQTMDRVGAVDFYYFPRSYFLGLREALGDSIHLVMVFDSEDNCAAGAVVFERGGIVQYHLSATRTAYLGHQPAKLLIHETSLWARSRGNIDFHLGGDVGGGDNTLIHFKTGFSDRSHPFHTWRIVLDEDAYNEVAAAVRPGVDASVMTGFFPVYRQRHSA